MEEKDKASSLLEKWLVDSGLVDLNELKALARAADEEARQRHTPAPADPDFPPTPPAKGGSSGELTADPDDRPALAAFGVQPPALPGIDYEALNRESQALTAGAAGEGGAELSAEAGGTSGEEVSEVEASEVEASELEARKVEASEVVDPRRTLAQAAKAAASAAALAPDTERSADQQEAQAQDIERRVLSLGKISFARWSEEIAAELVAKEAEAAVAAAAEASVAEAARGEAQTEPVAEPAAAETPAEQHPEPVVTEPAAETAAPTTEPTTEPETEVPTAKSGPRRRNRAALRSPANDEHLAAAHSSGGGRRAKTDPAALETLTALPVIAAPAQPEILPQPASATEAPGQRPAEVTESPVTESPVTESAVTEPADTDGETTVAQATEPPASAISAGSTESLAAAESAASEASGKPAETVQSAEAVEPGAAVQAVPGAEGSARARRRHRDTQAPQASPKQPRPLAKNLRRPILLVIAMVVITAVFVGVLLWAFLPSTTPAAEEKPALEVVGKIGADPVLTLKSPLPLESSRVEVLTKGDGVVLQDEQIAVIKITVFSGQDGKRLTSTSSAGIISGKVNAGLAGEEVYAAIKGKTEGSRLLLIHPINTEGNAHMEVGVIDILYTTARGEAAALPAEMGVVVGDAGGKPTVTTGETPPGSLTYAPLVRGSGATISDGQNVLLRYIEYSWGPTPAVQLDRWAQPVTLKLDSNILAGIRGALVDQKVGSRIVVVLPPEEGNGTQTLVFVADVLAAWDESQENLRSL